jgi:shikimate kinase
MGTGKTAVGRELAARLGKEFIEMDALIERRVGRSIPEIFRQEGEIAFREFEIEAVEEIAGKKNAVIACGGGAVLNKINIDRLKKESIIVYLTASPQAILKRTSEDENGRPLLEGSDRAGRIREMLKYRRPFYERAADITVTTSRLGIAGVAKRIIEQLREHEYYR